MIQIGTLLNVIDNTGAKKARCIKIFPGFKRRYAFVGDVILVSINSLRSKRRESIKVKKGAIHKALILSTKSVKRSFNGDLLAKSENPSIVLLNKQNKIIATRILSGVSKTFRFTKFIKILTLSLGNVSY